MKKENLLLYEGKDFVDQVKIAYVWVAVIRSIRSKLGPDSKVVFQTMQGIGRLLRYEA